MMMRSAPPFSMNLALMPVPAPAAMIGSPFFKVARRRSTTSFRVYGFPLPVHGFGISQRAGVWRGSGERSRRSYFAALKRTVRLECFNKRTPTKHTKKFTAEDAEERKGEGLAEY